MSAFIRNAWYVAAWDHEVTRDDFLARTILDIPLLFWRDSQGNMRAFADRCCHRGTPLSAGRREGDAIRCMYHGLKFDCDGVCVEIPSQKNIPAKARVRVFPVVEQQHWIWIWMGDPALADKQSIPLTPYLDDPDWNYVPGYVHYDTNYLLIADNLLDFSHFAYVHPTTLGEGGADEYSRHLPKVERLINGVKISRWLIDQPPAPFYKKIKSWNGNVDRWNNYDFLLPGILLMDAGSAPTGTGAQQGHRVEAAELRSYQALTPETGHSTHYFFSQPHNFAKDNPALTETVHQGILIAFEEDRAMIHAQHRSLAADADFPMLLLGMDAALVQFRRLVSERLEDEAAVNAEHVP
ncbi:aromatic ring-hydroxylating dioxygenase subunit alpha [Paraburkholderia sediminicola]|uniref:aromatic ring-hydroxylating dioxygenase subunit alpha n=1 Tax=Paraburkholderia sediminicola TaxID=458836 RepID=UPI0038BA99CD